MRSRPKGLTLVERLRGFRRSVRALRLRTNSEFNALKPLPNIADISRIDLPEPGVWARFVEAEYIPEEAFMAWLAGRTKGEVAPGHDGSGGALRAGVIVSRIKQAIHFPAFGAVVTQKGEALASSIAEALYLTPSLAGLPKVTMAGDAALLKLPLGAPVIHQAAVFMAWGGRTNYGHFLIDCLSALAALDKLDLLDRWGVIAPPLKAWQKDALSLLLGAERAAEIREIESPVVWVDDLVFASPMDHFLHAPNRPLGRVRTRMMEAIDEPPTGLSAIYINRLSDNKRQLVNEAELEAALIERGFVSIAPETLPLSKQIALFRDADIIVAPTGAALANVLFCKPGAKVLEIQPTNFTGIWVRQIAHFVRADWHGFFAPSPLYDRQIYVEGKPKPGLEFRWEVCVNDVLDWLAAATATEAATSESVSVVTH